MDRLYKSNKDKVFDGVCGGIGEYFGVDPVIIRLLWIILVIFGGTGVLAYLVAMVIIPKQASAESASAEKGQEIALEKVSHKFWGILLVLAGLLLLLGILGPISGIFAGAAILMGSVLWPLLVIALGLYLFFNQSGKTDLKSSIDEVFPQGRRLYKSRTDRRIAGVCGGIGEYFDVDSNLIRIFWVMATLGSFGFGILMYLVLAVFLTDDD